MRCTLRHSKTLFSLSRTFTTRFSTHCSFGIFKSGVTIEEVATFYNVHNLVIPKTRPYTWSMQVGTLDGITSFKEQKLQDASEINLKTKSAEGSAIDLFLLHCGWLFSDAILTSGATLRSEPTLGWPTFDEKLLDFRYEILKKKILPLQLILTASGDLPANHNLLETTKLRKLVLTTTAGFTKLQRCNSAHFGSCSQVEHDLFSGANNNSVLVVEQPRQKKKDSTAEENADNKAPQLDLTSVFQQLRSRFQIELLDVSAGGSTIGSLLAQGLLDEYHLTLTAQLCGAKNSKGEQRPSIYTPPLPQLPPDNPLLSFRAIRLFGTTHLFLRALVEKQKLHKNKY